jgi:hypothetical protein
MKIHKKSQAGVEIIEMTAEDAGRGPLCGYRDPRNEGYRLRVRGIGLHRH